MSAFKNDVAEFGVAFLKSVGSVDAGDSSANDDHVVVGSTVWLIHDCGDGIPGVAVKMFSPEKSSMCWSNVGAR